MWWGIYLVACGQMESGGYWTFYSALYLAIHLRFVNGIPTQEQRLNNNPAYRIYRIQTNIFVPWCYIYLPPEAIEGMTQSFTGEIEAELKQKLELAQDLYTRTGTLNHRSS